ncbi:MAG: CHAT domain-containing protein [Alphaproteobacteria bacterium]|nr:CHAT domain-containing protein [Alphaproteobacteria bacterium]
MATLSLGRGQDGHAVLFQSDGGAPVEGRLDPARVDAAREVVTVALARPAGLRLPSDDVTLTAREAEAGAALAALFTGEGMDAVVQAVARWRGRREATRAAPWLGIDAEGALAALPWELIEAAPPRSGAVAGCAVARVVGGRDVPSRALTSVCLVSPTPDDPVCVDVLERAAATIHAAGLQAHRARAADPVVHVVAHGTLGASGFGVTREDGAPLAVDTVRATWAEPLEAATLVVLDVCRGGAEDAVDTGLAARVAAHGAVVVAAGEPLDARAATALAQGLYDALGAGRSLGDALRAARGALRQQALTARHGRWWVPRVALPRDPERVWADLDASVSPHAAPPAPAADATPVPAAAPARGWGPWLALGVALGVAGVAGGVALTASPPTTTSPDPAVEMARVDPSRRADPPGTAAVVAPPDAADVPVSPPHAPAAAPPPAPTATAGTRRPAPTAPGHLEVRPVGAARVRLDVGDWQAASRVLPARWTVDPGPHAVEVDADGTTFRCPVDVAAGGTVRLCPDPGLAGCRCP